MPELVCLRHTQHGAYGSSFIRRGLRVGSRRRQQSSQSRWFHLLVLLFIIIFVEPAHDANVLFVWVLEGSGGGRRLTRMHSAGAHEFSAALTEHAIDARGSASDVELGHAAPSPASRASSGRSPASSRSSLNCIASRIASRRISGVNPLFARSSSRSAFQIS